MALNPIAQKRSFQNIGKLQKMNAKKNAKTEQLSAIYLRRISIMSTRLRRKKRDSRLNTIANCMHFLKLIKAYLLEMNATV